MPDLCTDIYKLLQPLEDATSATLQGCSRLVERKEAKALVSGFVVVIIATCFLTKYYCNPNVHPVPPTTLIIFMPLVIVRLLVRSKCTSSLLLLHTVYHK